MVERGPFDTASLAGVDAVCAERARTPDGATMLPYIGTSGASGSTQRRGEATRAGHAPDTASPARVPPGLYTAWLRR